MKAHETLGYTTSSRFIGPDQLDRLPANELAFAVRLASKACKEMESEETPVSFEGVYVLQKEPQSPAIPVAYVVEVGSEEAARKIHQFVWNQNQTPFLIVESPQSIRIYPGFSFDRESDSPLAKVAKGTADALEKLAAFRAESIDDGSIWKTWAHAVDPSQRVDESLLRDLRKLDERLQSQHGMDRNTSHGLIGKYVYLNYLRDRGILSDKKLAKWEIEPDLLFTRKATLKAFRKVNKELQEWLNGSVFSLGDEAVSQITADQLRLVAGVFSGDSPVGSDSVQLSLFSFYDFSHIPIETLSCVYEQFLHDAKKSEGPSRGKELGAYYTPLPLADYVLAEMNRRRPLQPGMSVLDPACGSGAFLVQCYRRLIEGQRRVESRELRAAELRELLTRHIFGIDLDPDACRVAELSLIMTLLDYVDPPDLEHTNFKLPSLRNQNIIQGDFFDVKGPACDLLASQKFDWIVGNPPWAEVKGVPAKDHDHYNAHQWMVTHKKTHPTSGNQLAEAFLWKAGDHLAPDGACGLVVSAMTWFKKEATPFRQRFFSERRVWCLANFANMGFVLFARRSNVGASVIFFDPVAPRLDDTILTFSPFVAEQIANRPSRKRSTIPTWNIVVGSGDLREIENSQAQSGDSLTWKLAMWGIPRDRKLLERLDERFKDERFSSLKQIGIGDPCEGFQMRNPTEAEKKHQAQVDQASTEDERAQLAKKKMDKLTPCPELEGKKILSIDKLRNCERIFAFPDVALERIKAEDCFIRLRGGLLGLGASEPPHIVVDASRRFAVFSDEFIAIPPRQIGVKGGPASSNQMRALSLFLSSDFCTYHQFLASPQWGIDMNRADLHALLKLPVPLSRLSESELNDWGKLQQQLAALSARQFASVEFGSTVAEETQALVAELNDRVFKLLGLRKAECWLIHDFVHLQMELTKGKVTDAVTRTPSAEERQEYLLALQECLDGFFSSERGLRHKLEVLSDRESAMLSVSLVKSKTSVEPVVIEADDPASRNLKTIRDRLRTQHSQWVYFDRNLKVYDPQQGVLYQFKPLQRLHWTRRQAVLDADDIIAETMAQGGVS